jgi:Phosphotyrosyl phosphate activator (PTPA) protein
MTGHKYIRPKSIHDADVVEEYSKYYMYLACIKFINSVRPRLSRDGSCQRRHIDQDCLPTMALPHAGRHIGRKYKPCGFNKTLSITPCR